MPELPEVETIVRQLRRRLLLPARITGCGVLHSRALRHISAPVFRRRVRGTTIRGIERRAKYIRLVTDAGAIIIHLGMTGHVFVVAGSDLRDIEYLRWWLKLETASKKQPPVYLALSDMRTFGFAGLEAGTKLEKSLRSLGPEPLGPDCHATYLRSIFKNRGASVKNLLLNQHLIAGIGNIYASEILFRAGIHPGRPGRRITISRLECICRHTRDILKHAIRQKGTTAYDYRTVENKAGNFQNFLRVYQKDGQPCPRCRTPIRRMVQAGRSTFFCPACQR